MSRSQLFPQPDFIPKFVGYNRLAGLRIGITGQRGVLGQLLTGRMLENEIYPDSYPGDIADLIGLSSWFSERTFDLFFHFAAIVPVGKVDQDPDRAFAVNALGAYEVCKHIVRRNHACWVFLSSTSHVYRPLPASDWYPLKVGDKEEPHSIYGRTKLASEQLCRQYLEARGCSYCIGRIFSFSHRTQAEPYLVPTLIRRIRELRPGQKLRLENADSLRDIVDAETVIDAILYLAINRTRGTVNIGSGKAMTIADIAGQIGTVSGVKLEIERESKGVAEALVADVEHLRSILLNSYAAR